MSKGFALAYVLILSVIMSVIAGGLLSLMTHQHQLAHRQEQSSKGKKQAEMALARMIGGWNSVAGGPPCSNTIPGYTCGAPLGVCGCACAPASSGLPTISTAIVGGDCQVQIIYPLP